MHRIASTPRDGWLETVEGQGLTYAVDRGSLVGPGDDPASPPTGGSPENPIPYWDESAAYVLSSAEVEYLETVTERLHGMAVAAAQAMVEDTAAMGSLGLPIAATELVRESLRAGQPSLYGRFDLAWDGTGPAKLLEYNADTPAGLVEAAVTQWYWLEDVHPDRDQFTTLHERLVAAWPRVVRGSAGSRVHFAVGQAEPTEDWATVAYLRDTAAEAGFADLGVVMEDIGWWSEGQRFVDGEDQVIETCFKMYPWEWMLDERFGPMLYDDQRSTQWIEPLWKMLLGSKTLLATMWEQNPGDENLLATHLGGPRELTEWVSKPVFGWEGAGIRVHTADTEVAGPVGHTAGQATVFQQFTPLPDFDGNHPVVGSWIVEGSAAGIGIRESTSLITDTAARFVPHYIDAPRSSPEEVQQWLRS